MNDDRLRSAFAELRRIEALRVPPFGGLLSSRARRPSLRLAFAIVLLIVLAVAIVPRRPPQPSITTWRAPTDFLLKTPGQELLESVPDLKGNQP
jgi:hypothetical protein